MTARVLTNRHKTPSASARPKTMDGAKEIKVLAVQATDAKMKTSVYLVLEIVPGDWRVIENVKIDQLGRPAKWLNDLLMEQLYPDLAKERSTKQPNKPLVLPDDNVDVEAI